MFQNSEKTIVSAKKIVSAIVFGFNLFSFMCNCAKKYPQFFYTLPKKKHNFNFQIFYDDPGPESATLGHVHQGKCSREQQAKDPIEKYQTVLSVHSIIWVHIFPWLSQNSWNPIAANANSVIFLNVAFLFGKSVCEWNLGSLPGANDKWNFAQCSLTYTPPKKKGDFRKVWGRVYATSGFRQT